ncbi:MAG: CNP1-like family protein [Burkholderiaceae bacterium]|jgi:hypothetical protein|nr:CNP1-like family protein [Burkholderiaceae bacterium]
MKPPPRRRKSFGKQDLLAAALLLAAPVMAQQYASDELSDWREDTIPPPPAYTTRPGQLIDIDMPPISSVKMGIDPATITVNPATGIVRYVVVARGTSAVNAAYEGIRCSTAEYRVYARRTEDNPWSPSTETEWKPMRGQSGVIVTHPYQLAKGGLCFGTAVRHNVDDMVRELRSGNQSLYLGR